MAAAVPDKTQLEFSHSLSRDAPHGAVDIAQFRQGMRALAGAVTVLTTGSGAARLGLTATAVCSLSGEPPRLIACVNQRGVTFEAMRSHGAIAVNVLSGDQIAVAQRFAGMDKSTEDRFARGLWRAGAWRGVPVLDGSCCSFECAIAEIVDAGTHGILICDIMGVSVDPHAKPLLYSDGRFATLHEELADPRYALQF